MNLREKKVLTTAERNQLVNEYGPLQIVTVAATEEMPKITKLIDKEGLCTSHFMVQDLFEWQYGNEIEELPADEYVPVGPTYTLSYSNEGGVVPETKKFRLTQGEYILTEDDLPVLEDPEEGYDFRGWMIDGQVVEAGYAVKGSVVLLAKWIEVPTYEVTLVTEGEGVEFSVDKNPVEEGNVVTITATPEEGYEVKSLTAVGPEGELDLTEVSENVWSFVMPAGEVEVNAVGGESEPEMVDLGLPSGILWAKCNLGAQTETEAGNYYQWGSTTPLHIEGTTVNPPADWDHCPYCTSTSPTFSKYTDNDGILNLEASDDIVTVTYGTGYRMPTQDEYAELLNGTDHESIILEGINCLKFINKSDSSKYIILPVAGFCENSELKEFNSHGVYWSSTRASFLEQFAEYLAFNTESASVGSIGRFRGGSIRGIYDPS